MLLGGYTPMGLWGGVFYASLVAFARVFYWYLTPGNIKAQIHRIAAVFWSVL